MEFYMEDKKQQEFQMKKSLIDSLHKVYSELVKFVESVPINNKIKEFAIKHFDEGLMWTREGIGVINFNFEEKKPEENSDIEKVEDKSL